MPAISVLLEPMLEFEVIDHAETPFGTLILRRRDVPVAGVIELALDHQFLMSSAVTDSERELATRAIALHGGTDLDVMVGGLGLGYTCKAALDTGRAARVEVVELSPAVIRWVKTGVVPLGAELVADTRLHITQQDVFERLRNPPTAKHDLLLIDVDHSPDEILGETSSNFYAHENLALAAHHLRPGGVFALWSTSDSPWFRAELGKAFREVVVEPIDFFNETVGAPETNWLFLARHPSR